MYSTLGVNFLPKYVKNAFSYIMGGGGGYIMLVISNMSTLFVNKVVFVNKAISSDIQSVLQIFE